MNHIYLTGDYFILLHIMNVTIFTFYLLHLHFRKDPKQLNV